MASKSKIKFWCGFMEIALLIGIIFTPMLGQAVVWLQAENGVSVMGGGIHTECEIFHGSPPNTSGVDIARLFHDCIFSLILWKFYKVFKDIRMGSIFNQQQIKRISFSGWCLISLSIYSIISDALSFSLQKSEIDFQFYFQIDNLYYIPMGVGLVILSYVLKLAEKIKEEQGLVI